MYLATVTVLGLLWIGAPVALDGRPTVISMAATIPGEVSGLVTKKSICGDQTLAAVAVGAFTMNMYLLNRDCFVLKLLVIENSESDKCQTSRLAH